MPDLELIVYADGPTALTARLARPAGTPRAGILVFPTIANANPPVERRARMLAEAGYLALIADFYGAAMTDASQGQELAKTLRADVDGYRSRLAAALAALRGQAPGLPLAAIGYCMGGQAALELARDGAEIRAAVSLHGILDTGRPAEPGAVKARLLVCHGDADPLAPRAAVLKFWDEMTAAGAHWHFHAYSGVKHGFTDPASDTRGAPQVLAYDASADRQSWAAMLSLFDEVFG